MAVLLIDPNQIPENVNTKMLNAIPQYQDMYIFAELTAKSRGRSVLFTSSNSGLYRLSPDSTNQDIVVNFLGNNQDSTQPNPNYLNFTTDWYDGSTGNRRQTEGFGISNIKVVINSSYIPQVEIQFIDLRGLAFFNQENSPYRILFNFPPPIFYLTLKGYYGKPLMYMLHLVKYTSEFKAENGNFIIDAQFIAMTFAPLTDVLFRYIVNFPLIPNADKSNAISMNPAPGEKPKNTFELILKLKKLYSQQSLPKTIETIQYEETLKNINILNNAIISLNSYKDDTDLKKWAQSNGISLYRAFDNPATQTTQITSIPSTNIFDTAIQNSSNTPEGRLILAYQHSTTKPDSTAPARTVYQYLPFGSTNLNINSIADQKATVLNKFIGKIIKMVDNPITIAPKDVPAAKQISAINTTNQTSTKYTYMSIDITDFYTILYNKRTELLNQNIIKINQINATINNMIYESLGMQPTIYNIFKLILDDVDNFFNILRTTSNIAENTHHVVHKNEILKLNYRDILNNANSSDTKIFAFPLVISTQTICKQVKETRIAPIELSDSIVGDPFPEIQLVRDFINTFITQRNLNVLYDMKSTQNADGTYSWIPVTPFDSDIGTGDTLSPYFGVDTSNGGSTTQQISLTENPKIVQIVNILLKRFYILSQFSIPHKFYSNPDYLNFFAESEAINLVASLFNTETINLLLTQAKNWNGNAQNFYDFVKAKVPTMYTFTQEQHPFFCLSDGDDIIESRTDLSHKLGDSYVNKKNTNYSGFTWHIGAITPQLPATTNTTATDSNNAVQTFITAKKQGFFSKVWNGITLEGIVEFANQNFFYFNDINPNNKSNALGIVNTETRFLSNANVLDIQVDAINSSNNKMLYTVNQTGGISKNANSINRIDFINIINNDTGGYHGTPYGNSAFNQIKPPAPIQNFAKSYQAFTNIVSLWADQLGTHDDEIYNNIIDYNNTLITDKYDAQLASIVLISNFGYSLSPFNIYPNDLNLTLFNIPAAIQTPTFVLYYMGSLIGVKYQDTFYNKIYNFFVNGSGKTLNSCGVLIFADIADLNNQLAEVDKNLISSYYTLYYNDTTKQGTYFDIRKPLLDLYIAVRDDPTVKSAKSATDKITAKKLLYARLLDPNNTTGTVNFYNQILQPLIERNNIINFSEITFERDAPNQIGYNSLSVTNKSANNTINNNYFTQLFSNVVSKIVAKQAEQKKQAEEDKKLGDDEDIIIQTYYSFKNINDKWVSTPKANSPLLGYPFNEMSTVTKEYHLIDLFAFVDRAMNPIGDTIINPQHLIEILNDENATVFSVLSELLAINNFEFFPLQNFMSFQNGEWVDSFKIDTNGTVNAKPAFVCMYFGGSSSYLTGIKSFGGQFEDDCITDLSNPNDAGKDFDVQVSDCIYNTSNDAQVQNNPFFPYGQVRAYRVRFAEQNQSMFTNIKIDSKEYPETNESIKILSRIAGDNKLQAPTPKGQNLYNLYENRSYRATVTGLGNMMLQPTQYFQIENVPLFNGAYITLAVEHNIEPNKMVTSVSGTKILKYPVPRILEASSILGFPGGNTSNTNAGEASIGTVEFGPNGLNAPLPAQHNSMYKFKIQ